MFVPEVDLVLPRRHFVMRRLDVKPHRLERQHNLPADVLAPVHRGQIEVAPGVVRQGRRRPVPHLKEEELRLGACAQREAPLGGPRDDPLERRARAAHERCAFRVVDVADQPADLAARRRMGRPGKHPVGREIRLEEHVRFLNPDEPLDRGPIEHDPAVERLLELAVGNLDVLDHPENVGELQAHELHARALGRLQDFALASGQVLWGFTDGHDGRDGHGSQSRNRVRLNEACRMRQCSCRFPDLSNSCIPIHVESASTKPYFVIFSPPFLHCAL